MGPCRVFKMIIGRICHTKIIPDCRRFEHIHIFLRTIFFFFFFFYASHFLPSTCFFTIVRFGYALSTVSLLEAFYKKKTTNKKKDEELCSLFGFRLQMIIPALKHKKRRGT